MSQDLYQQITTASIWMSQPLIQASMSNTKESSTRIPGKPVLQATGTSPLSPPSTFTKTESAQATPRLSHSILPHAVAIQCITASLEHGQLLILIHGFYPPFLQIRACHELACEHGYPLHLNLNSITQATGQSESTQVHSSNSIFAYPHKSFQATGRQISAQGHQNQKDTESHP